MLITVRHTLLDFFATHFRKKTPNVTLTSKNEQEAFYMIKLNTYLFTAAVAISQFLPSKFLWWLNGRGLLFIVHKCVYF